MDIGFSSEYCPNRTWNTNWITGWNPWIHGISGLNLDFNSILELCPLFSDSELNLDSHKHQLDLTFEMSNPGFWILDFKTFRTLDFFWIFWISNGIFRFTLSYLTLIVNLNLNIFFKNLEFAIERFWNLNFILNLDFSL